MKNINKEEFKDLFFNEGWTEPKLRKKYKIRKNDCLELIANIKEERVRRRRRMIIHGY